MYWSTRKTLAKTTGPRLQSPGPLDLPASTHGLGRYQNSQGRPQRALLDPATAGIDGDISCYIWNMNEYDWL